MGVHEAEVNNCRVLIISDGISLRLDRSIAEAIVLVSDFFDITEVWSRPCFYESHLLVIFEYYILSICSLLTHEQLLPC